MAPSRRSTRQSSLLLAPQGEIEVRAPKQEPKKQGTSRSFHHPDSFDALCASEVENPGPIAIDHETSNALDGASDIDDTTTFAVGRVSCDATNIDNIREQSDASPTQRPNYLDRRFGESMSLYERLSKRPGEPFSGMEDDTRRKKFKSTPKPIERGIDTAKEGVDVAAELRDMFRAYTQKTNTNVDAEHRDKLKEKVEKLEQAVLGIYSQLVELKHEL